MKTTTKKTTRTARHTTDTKGAAAASETAASPATKPAPSASLASLVSPPAPLVIPTEAQVAEWVSTLEGVRTLLGNAAAPLTAEERRHALRAKKGGEPTANLIATLGQQYNLQLPGVDPNGIQQNALLATRLQPLETKLRVISGLVTDTVANAKTESWQGTTSLYTALLRASTRNAALQKELKPAVEFFKRSRAASATPTVKNGKSATSATSGGAPATTATSDAPPPTTDPEIAPAPAAVVSPAAAPGTTSAGAPKS